MPRTTESPMQPYLFQPVSPVTRFRFSEAVEEMRARFFPQVDERVEVRIVADAPLAFVRFNFMGPRVPMIAFHPILNHPETPREVVQFIAKHELTHLLFPAEGHSPRFWEHEARVSPERYGVWRWINANLSEPTRHLASGFTVLRSWGKRYSGPRVPYMPNLPWATPEDSGLCEGDGQMMFPPHWSRLPLPFSD